MLERKNLKETKIEKINKSDLSDDMKNILLQMNDLYWEYSNYNPNHESHAFRVAEGIKICMNCIEKYHQENKNLV
jgi:hypothetical protein